MVVDGDGNLNPSGRYVWLEQMELNPGVNSNQIMRYFIDEFARLLPHTRWTYWVRRDKTGTKIHGPYNRQQVIRFMSHQQEVVK